jgi:ribosomal protein L33
MSQDTRIQMQCTVCKNIGYQGKRNKKGKAATAGKMTRLEIMKFCRFKDCRKHTLHKEIK